MFLAIKFLAIDMALLPFMYPLTPDTANLGGILTHICTGRPGLFMLDTTIGKN